MSSPAGDGRQRGTIEEEDRMDRTWEVVVVPVADVAVRSGATGVGA